MLFALPLSAQNHALVFDGADDFVEVHPMPGIGQFNTDGFSAEFIIELGTRYNSYEVLLYQENRYGITELGLQGGLSPYIYCHGEHFLFEEVELPTDGCLQLSFVYQAERLELYLNGQLQQTLPVVLPSPIMEENLPFYLGQRFPDGATTFSGRMEDMRIFRHALSLAEIQQRLFQEVEMTAFGKYVHLPFFQYFSAYTRDPFNPDCHAYLGGIPVQNNCIPDLTEDVCMSTNLPESVDPNCQTDPTLMPSVCNTAGLAPNEFLCNGDFEQFCSILNNPLPNSTPPMAFLDVPALTPASDVVNWEISGIPVNGESPDFYVRDGLGSPFGFAPTFMCPGNYPHPSDTYNGQGNGVAAIGYYFYPPGTIFGYPNGYHFRESFQTEIRSGYQIQPGGLYSFEGWFYRCIPQCSGVNNGNSTILLELLDQNGQSYYINNFTVQNFNTIIGNNQWQSIQFQFIAPNFIGASTAFSHISLTNFSSTISNAANPRFGYIYMDDLSLKEVSANNPNPTLFPQYLNTGDDNDFFKRIIKEDANGDIYIAGQIIDPSTSQLQFGLQPILATHSLTNQEGSFIAKYASDGTLLWTFFEEFFMVNDMEIIGNEVFAVGYTTPFPAGVISPLFSINGGTATGNSENMCIARLNTSTGNLIGNIEVWGSSNNERAIGVEVFGNTAKIALDKGGSALMDWGTFGVLNDAVLIYNLSSHLPFNFSQLSLGNDYLIDFDSDGNDWFLLTNTRLLKEGGPSQTLPTIGAQTFSAHDLHVTSGGDLFLAYNENSSAPPIIEKRDNTTLSAIGQFNAALNSSPLTSHAIPLSIAGDASNLFVAYEHLMSSSPMDQQLRIDKYDFSSSNAIPLWSSGVYSSNGANARFAGDLGGAANSPLDMVQRAIGGLAVFGNFVTDNQTWTWNLPPKSLTCNGTPALPSTSHSFVAVVNDQGSNGIFGKNGNSVDDGISQNQEILLYPNPLSVHKELTIQSPFAIYEIRFQSLHGQTVQHRVYEGINDELTLRLLDLPEGIYLIQVNGLKEGITKKLVVE